MRIKDTIDLNKLKASEPATLDEAFFDLDKRQFLIWILLNSIDSKMLKGGLNVLARKFRYEVNNFRRVVAQLVAAGYLEYADPMYIQRCKKREIRIIRRALVAGKNSFVKL